MLSALVSTGQNTARQRNSVIQGWLPRLVTFEPDASEPFPRHEHPSHTVKIVARLGEDTKLKKLPKIRGKLRQA
jgi:hypothetical protein